MRTVVNLEMGSAGVRRIRVAFPHAAESAALIDQQPAFTSLKTTLKSPSKSQAKKRQDYRA